MRLRHAMLTLLVLAATLLTACSGNEATTAEPRSTPVSLDEVRRYAQKALDGMSSSDDRQQARDAAVRSLLDLLKTPESARIAKGDWEKPVVQGDTPMVRVFEAGKVKVFGFPLPGPGVVPPGERLIVQFTGAEGALQSGELATLSGGRLAAAKALEEGNQLSLTLAFTLARGGGYVAHYQLDARANEFKPATGAFKGLPPKVGEFTLEAREQFLTVNMPNPDDWRPQFDPKQPLRLFFTSDMALEWKGGKYQILDERNFSAFAGLQVALDPKTPQAQRDEAWEKATRKLPGYLQEMASWNEDLSAKLPAGAAVLRDQMANLNVRLVSIPAPEAGKDGFTVVQYRTGGGLPQAQAVTVPGKAESARVITRQGLFGLLLLSGDTGGPKGTPRKYVTLLKMTAGNDWAPAPDWFGWLPGFDGWSLGRTATQPSVEITHNLKPEFTAVLTPGTDPGVELCNGAHACYTLSWIDDRLSAISWVQGKLAELTAPGAVPTQEQIQQATTAVQAFLMAPDNKGLTAAQAATALGGKVRVFEPVPGRLVVGFPENASGIVPLLVQSGGAAVHRELPAPHVVDRWTDARVVETGEGKWLLVLGQGKVTAALVVYRSAGGEWIPASPLSFSVDRVLAETSRVSYSAGPASPVSGLYAWGSHEITASFTPDGKGVLFCDGKRACLTYVYDMQWVLR